MGVPRGVPTASRRHIRGPHAFAVRRDGEDSMGMEGHRLAGEGEVRVEAAGGRGGQEKGGRRVGAACRACARLHHR